MKFVDNLTIEYLQSLEIPTIRTNKKVTYLNIESSFDIETTSMYTNEGDKTAFMYIWAFGIGYGNTVFYGRTWNDFILLCEKLQQAYNLDDENRLVIYAHNLGYEFQFMRRYFEWEDVFSIDERKPLKALCSYGIEFRDSYILSGFSLENTAKNLAYHNVEKLVGDLDYELIRTKETPLTSEEMGYVKNDIDVVLAYINEQIYQYRDISKVPLTNTGRVRSYVRNECYYTDTNHRKSNKGKYYRYRKIMDDLTLRREDYIQLKNAFMGGFTHANAKYSGEKLQEVTSIDFNSSYPAVMLAEKFPMSRAKDVEIRSEKELEYYCNNYAVLFEIQLHNVTQKITQDNYISESKCYILENPVINNGRVQQASKLAMTITDVDYDIIKQCYDWELIEVKDVKRFHRGYLPKSIIESVLNLYKDKTELKGVEGYEVEYNLSKGMLNSVYGMSVTDIIQDVHTYDGEWGIDFVDVEEKIQEHNESKNRFLFYAWGVWITAFARKNLWTGIIAMGDDYIYADTDAIKFFNYEKHKPYIEWYDKQNIEKIEAMMNYYKLDVERLRPKTKDGRVEVIGEWDYEGTYTNFKTLGAKRYLVDENGKLELTVAGLSKQNGLNYMMKTCDNDVDKVFEMFNDELYIDAENTGKMTHTYIDDRMEFQATDYLGNSNKVEVETGIHLEKVEFTLSIGEEYKKFLSELKKGYIFKGVYHV